MHSLPVAQIKSFVELKDYVYETLCDKEQLAVGAFPMTQQFLRRGGQICGVIFSVHGPRSVTFNAVLDLAGKSVHFYSSSGERFKTTRFNMALSLP